MTWTKLGLLFLVATMLACGQVLFKVAAQSIKGPIGFNFQTVLQFVLNPYLLLSLAIYGIATLSWVLLLRNTELSKAYLGTGGNSGNLFASGTVVCPAGRRNGDDYRRACGRALVALAILSLSCSTPFGVILCEDWIASTNEHSGFKGTAAELGLGYCPCL
jgi:hypothetical protein